MRPRIARRRPSHALRLLAAAMVAAVAGLLAQHEQLLPRLEQDSVAMRYQARASERPTGIAVLAIDDATISREGRWPLPRDVHARAIDRLREAGARVIAYDVQFTEPSGDPDADYALYRAVGRAGNVVLATTETDGRGGTRVLGGDQNLRDARARAGDTNLIPEPGGDINRFARATGGLEALAVAVVERATDSQVPEASFPPGGAWIDYHGPTGTVPTYSLSRLVGEAPDRELMELLRGRIVVVGATAPSLQDVHATPVDHGRLMPGPELQANAISTVLRGMPLRTAPDWLNLAAILALAILPSLLSLRARGVTVALGGPLLGAGYLVLAYLAFEYGVVMSVTSPLIALTVATLGTVVVSYFGERSERRRVVDENDVLEELVRERTAQLRDTQLELVQRLGAAAESRDGETGQHINRVSVMTGELALALGMPREEAELLRHATALHDIGKIGIPDAILLKPGRLTREERAVMETHTTIGASILEGSASPLVRLAAEVSLSHHEKWDGSGYPHRLAGDAIPLSGRIVAICDVLDALVSARPYKAPWPLEEALAEIESQRGRHFDPEIVDLFVPLARALGDEERDASRPSPPELRGAPAIG